MKKCCGEVLLRCVVEKCWERESSGSVCGKCWERVLSGIVCGEVL